MSGDLLLQVVIWVAVAFILWMALIVLIGRLGVPDPGFVAAVLSWLVARLVIWGAPNLALWIRHLFAT